MPAIEETPIVKLIITLSASGNVNVAGIPDGKLICYGLLEMAKEAVAEYYKTQANKLIQPATRLPKGD